MVEQGDKRTQTVAVYALVALLCYPILEILIFGGSARHQAYDVFDDGAVSRLGAIRFDYLRHGVSLWNPHLTGGNAHLAQFTATPLSIDSVLSLLTTPFLAYSICFYLLILTSGLSMHIFLRQSMGLSRAASFAGGLFYMAGSKAYPLGFSVALLPLVLWLSDRAAKSSAGIAQRALLPALTGAFLLYNFSAQAALIAAAIQLAYDIFCSTTVKERRTRAANWVVAWSLALALYGPVVTTQMKLLPDSVRAIRDDMVWAPGPTAALKVLAEQYSETLFGRPTLISLQVPVGQATWGTWYLGVLGLGLLFLSFRLPRPSRRERFCVALLLCIPVLELLAMTVFIPIQEHLGPLRSFQFTRIKLFWPFCLSANVAVAYAALARLGQGERRARLNRGFWIGFVGLFVAQALVSARHVGYVIRRYGVSFADAVSRERLLGHFGAAAYFGAAAAVSFVLLWRAGQPSLGSPADGPLGRRSILLSFGILFVALLAVERLVYTRIQRLLSPHQLASFEGAFRETPAIRWLVSRQNAENDRVLLVQGQRRDLRPNHVMYHGLYCADGYQNIYPLRYHDVFGLLTKRDLDRDPVRRTSFRVWGLMAYALGSDINPALAKLMRIRWLYVRSGQLPDANWRPVFSGDGEMVYENPEVFPRAFLVGRAQVYRSRESLLAGLEAASVEDLRTTAFLQEGAAQGVPFSSRQPLVARAFVASDSPDRVTFRVETSAAALLVVTDTYAPGWEASVNGSRRPVFAVDDCFRGVFVPAGSSEVVFRYRPAYTYIGGWVALSALLLLAVSLAVERVQERRRAERAHR